MGVNARHQGKTAELVMDFMDRASRCWLARGMMCAGLITIVGLLGRPALNAQILAVNKLTASDAQRGTADVGSAIRKADRKTLELLEDFDRYAGKKAWGLAFKALDSLDESCQRRLVPAGDGFLVPTSDWVRQRLNRLPREGREAYRMFNDANFKRFWGQIHVRGEGFSSNRPAPARDAETFILPATDEPLWQIRIAGPHMPGQFNPQNGMRMNSTIHAAPIAAVVGDRIYVNWLGTDYAADLDTGKMLWRTGDFIEAPTRAIEYVGDSSTNCFALVPSGGKLFVMRPPVRNQLGETLAPDSARNVSLAIECLDAASGKTLWRAPLLNVFVLAGPYLVDGVEYLIASGARNEATLIGIDMQTGRVRTRVSLGSPPNGNNGGGNDGFGGPKMLASGGTLYVAANNRSLYALNRASHEIEWVLELGSSPESDSQPRVSIEGLQETSFVGQSTLVENDGVIYFQDGSVPLLIALDPAELNMKWKRPTSVEVSIVAIEWPIAYLVGSEFSALDLKSRKLLWSAKIPAQKTMARPLICPEHIYLATSRGIFDIDPADGGVRRIFRGADRDSSGGRLLLAGDKLIVVSDGAVTAYGTTIKTGRTGSRR